MGSPGGIVAWAVYGVNITNMIPPISPILGRVIMGDSVVMIIYNISLLNVKSISI